MGEPRTGSGIIEKLSREKGAEFQAGDASNKGPLVMVACVWGAGRSWARVGQRESHGGFVGWQTSLCGFFPTNAPIILGNQSLVGDDSKGGKNDMVVVLRREYRGLWEN